MRGIFNCTKDDLPGASQCVLISTYSARYFRSGNAWVYPHKDRNISIPYRIGLWNQPMEVNKIGRIPSADPQWPAITPIIGGEKLRTWPRPRNFNPQTALYAFEPNVETNYDPNANPGGAPDGCREGFPGWLADIENGDLVMVDLDTLHPMPDRVTSWGNFHTTKEDAVVGRRRRKVVGEYIRKNLDRFGKEKCKTVIFGGFPIRGLGKETLTDDQKLAQELTQMKEDHSAWVSEGVIDAWDMSAWVSYWRNDKWRAFEDLVGDWKKIHSTIPARAFGKPLGVVFRPYFSDVDDSYASYDTPMEYPLLKKIFEFFETHFDFIIIWEGRPIPCHHHFWRAYYEFITN